jgi:rhodanese-related sulfurtransferase/transcriptional regulator with XRE-family HTH domain
MVQSLGPLDVQALITEASSASPIDIIDVRDARDWASGHVPGARSVPLEELRGDPRAKAPKDRVLFVCARGVRSLAAAQLAEELGRTQIYSLDGGMLAWAGAGLPIEAAPAQSSATARAAAREVAGPGAETAQSAEAPEPALDAVVGENLHALRSARGLSLDTLARLTGLSRTLLGQIELGKTSPSVGVVWKLARAFDVPFSMLLATAQSTAISVLRTKAAKRIVGGDGKFSSRALFPLGGDPDAEFYELSLAPYSREDAQPHQPGTRENLVVAAGRLELIVGAERFELSKGDAIVFGADVAHSYANPDKEECWMYLVMTYGRRAPQS